MSGTELRVLAFHRAVGFVHQSIPVAVEALVGLGARHGFGVETIDDPARFTSGVCRDEPLPQRPGLVHAGRLSGR